MPEHSRLQPRRSVRRRGISPVVVAVTLVLMALVIVGGGVLVWSRLKPSKAATLATGTPQASATSTPGLVKPKSVVQTAPPEASGTAAPAADPDAASVIQAGAKAVEAAAVPYPGAPAIAANTPSLNHAHPRHKYIAITLDDGFNFQPQMLDLLEQYDARCTTFLIGSWAAGHKSILARLHKDGFEIANHTWDHATLTKLSRAQIASELTRDQKVISSVTGNQAPYVRPPGGATNSTVKAVAASLGMRIVMWDRTFGDSGRGPTPQKLYNNAVVSNGGVKPGDIILCHWGSNMSYEAMKRVLPDLKAQGYEFVTISELLADSKGSSKP